MSEKAARQVRPDNIKEGGYQPISDPPPPPTGPVAPQAVNPITGNPNPSPGPGAPGRDQAPAPRANDGQ